MLAASTLAILIVPVLFVIITRLSYGKKELDYLKAHHEELMEREKKIEQQKIDPELEYEMTHNYDQNKNSRG
jgi:HAE1 family hydrophobic/amphiphilic exporter-1